MTQKQLYKNNLDETFTPPTLYQQNETDIFSKQW